MINLFQCNLIKISGFWSYIKKRTGGYRSNKNAMIKEKRPHVCPAELACSLDNSIRRLVHKPGKILEAYIKKEMTVLDLGCGPGYFTIELANLGGDGGKVIARSSAEYA